MEVHDRGQSQPQVVSETTGVPLLRGGINTPGQSTVTQPHMHLVLY